MSRGMRDTAPRITTPGTDGANHDGAERSIDDTIFTVPAPGYAATEHIVVQRPKRRRARMIAAVLLVVVLAATGAYFLFRPAQGLPTASVRRGTIISTVETTGKLQA